jgi:hypothetical protein
MRELARCIAWALALGAAALVAAAFAGFGLAQVDGAWAWAVLLVYSPFYLLGYVFGADTSYSTGLSPFDAAVFGGQFLYFLVIVASVRFALGKNRRRSA